MKIALIFSKPISPSIAKLFCRTFIQDHADVKAIYMINGRFKCWTDDGGDDTHCFDFANGNNFKPIYITIL